MDGNVIPINEKTTVIIKVSGDLFLQGDEVAEVRFGNSEDRIRVNQSNDNLYIETHASLDQSVPRTAKVIVEKVGGSAFLQDLEGALMIQKIGGDLALQRLSEVRVEKVGGGCLIEGITSALTLGKVGGDLVVRQAMGPVAINTGGGDINLQLAGDGPLSARAGGDMHVYFTEGLAQPITLTAGGDLRLYVPTNINANFRLDCGSEEIKLQLSRQAQPIAQEIEARRYEFTLGEGGEIVELRAGGDLLVSDETIEPAPISADLERRESVWKETRDRRGAPTWSGGFGFDRTSAWAEMISRRAQEASRRAEQRVQSATRRTEDQIRQAAEREMRRAESRSGFPMPSVPPRPPMPPTPSPVTEQEQLMVLQMLKDGKISIEQAESLLAALEGRYNL